MMYFLDDKDPGDFPMSESDRPIKSERKLEPDLILENLFGYSEEKRNIIDNLSNIGTKEE